VRRYLRDPTFSRFDTILECDRHTHRHTTTAYTALSITSRGKNGSRDVTTPISGTVCIDHKKLAMTDLCTKFEISIYVDPLPRYERRWKVQKLGWFGG